MSKFDRPLLSQSWQASLEVIECYLKSSSKLDELLVERTQNLPHALLPRIQFLSYGVVRNLVRLKALVGEVVKRRPKRRCEALLLITIWEWLQSEDTLKPKVVHHAVEQAKHLLGNPESAFVNAVLRQMPIAVASEPDARQTLRARARMSSHPERLLQRFRQQYGWEATLKWVNWNQQIPKIYCHFLDVPNTVPADLLPTDWTGFYEVSGDLRKKIGGLARSGRAYIQDPSTRLGPSLIVNAPVGSILDLCAAPGGKSVQLMKYLQAPGGLLVSVDLPGVRFERMKDNLARYKIEGIHKRQISADVLQLKAGVLPLEHFDCVYLDAPCSNSGVFQRRPDAKYRNWGNFLDNLMARQKKLISSAARFVKSGGLLIYSTCSIDSEENAGVVSSFLARHEDQFREIDRIVSLPWQSGHDGCGAFALKRIK